MNNTEKLLESIQKNGLTGGFYFRGDGSCACVLGHAFKIAEIKLNMDYNYRTIGMLNISIVEKLDEAFPELKIDWQELQNINDEIGDDEKRLEKVTEYIKSKIKES